MRGNAGGRQGAIGQFVRRATVLDLADEVQVRERDDLSFADRDSNLDEPLILSAEFELTHEEPEAVVRRMRRIWIIKKENQPYGHQSSGCIFKNPAPDVSAGALIDQAGLRGTRFGGAEVSDRHANFIVAHPGPRRLTSSNSSTGFASASGSSLVTSWNFRFKSGKLHEIGKAASRFTSHSWWLADLRTGEIMPDERGNGGIKVMEHREPPRIGPGDRPIDGSTTQQGAGPFRFAPV